MATNVLTTRELVGMIRHWLDVPPEGYLGSPYGADYYPLLQKPMSAGIGDAFIAKMREDIPVLNQLGPNTINLYYNEVPGSIDRKELIIEVLGEVITVALPQQA